MQIWKTAPYTRLSREDGDKPESDSILNQRKQLEAYTAKHPDLVLCGDYADDGYTGTNFDRPAFQKLIKDIEAGLINCVLVKDLSRFGRDYIEAGRYLERWFPEHNVRFIAINDQIDTLQATYDMMMPLKNIFNSQYAKDIAGKVKSAFNAKQSRGEFVGAFASYGYDKDPQDNNRLVIDPVAADVVRRVFSMFESGSGKIRIAKILNEEAVPCPSEYKRMLGLRYHNGQRLEGTKYWTYATIHRMLQNEMYIGNMTQAHAERKQMHGRAKQKAKEDWIVVKGTHEAIISQDQWDRVQALLNRNAKTLAFEENVNPFAGYLKCADCGRSMAKTRWNDKEFFSCGSYKRYGPTACTRHYIPRNILEQVLLDDLNSIIASVTNLRDLAEKGTAHTTKSTRPHSELDKMKAALARVQRMKQGIYEDYKEELLTRDEYMRYRKDYDAQEKSLTQQLERASESTDKNKLLQQPWVDKLVQMGKLTEIDRATIAATLKEIRISEGGALDIAYLFSEDLRLLLESVDVKNDFPNDSQDMNNNL